MVHEAKRTFLAASSQTCEATSHSKGWKLMTRGFDSSVKRTTAIRAPPAHESPSSFTKTANWKNYIVSLISASGRRRFTPNHRIPQCAQTSRQRRFGPMGKAITVQVRREGRRPSVMRHARPPSPLAATTVWCESVRLYRTWFPPIHNSSPALVNSEIDEMRQS
jgi:hypothetical protein